MAMAPVRTGDIILIGEGRADAYCNGLLAPVGMIIAANVSLSIELDALLLKPPDGKYEPVHFIYLAFGWFHNFGVRYWV
jgi:hypothetical protein